jgi:hypothetical protein
MSDKEVQFLEFKDWIDSAEYLRPDWIVVARFDETSNPDNRGTFSAHTRF